MSTATEYHLISIQNLKYILGSQLWGNGIFRLIEARIAGVEEQVINTDGGVRPFKLQSGGHTQPHIEKQQITRKLNQQAPACGVIVLPMWGRG